MGGTHRKDSWKYDEIRFRIAANVNARGRLMPKRDFGSIHAKHTGTSAWRSPSRDHFISRQKAKFHQTARDVLRKVQAIEDAPLSHGEIGKRQHGDS
jgi:hypothetical protein